MTLAPEPWNISSPYLPGVSQLWLRTKIIKFIKILIICSSELLLNLLLFIFYSQMIFVPFL